MTFHILQNSTTADAADENDNFYHIGQGSLLPRGGQSLAATDSFYDLGSSATAWNTLYCNNLVVESITSGNTGIWSKVYDSTVASGTSRIEVTGLNGDDSEVYNLFIYGVDSTGTSLGSIYLALNGDSSASYGYHDGIAIGSTITASRNISQTSFTIGQMAANTNSNISFASFVLYAKTGNERTIAGEYVYGYNTTAYQLRLISQIWDNTADTLTSMVFHTSGKLLGVGTQIVIFKKV